LSDLASKLPVSRQRFAKRIAVEPRSQTVLSRPRGRATLNNLDQSNLQIV
jgi:hypothetical protein